MLTDAQVYCMTFMIYLFRPLKPSIEKRRKQSCTPNTRTKPSSKDFNTELTNEEEK